MRSDRLSFKQYYLIFTILLLVSLIVSARVGAITISYEKIFAFTGKAIGIEMVAPFTPIEEALFWKIRLPRVLLCAIVGAALSVSGALMQALFRNPIVEPDW